MKLLLLNGVFGFSFYYDYLDELDKLSKADRAVYEDYYTDDYQYNYYFYDDNEPIKVTETSKPISTPQPVAVSVPKPAVAAVTVPAPIAIAASRPPVAVKVPSQVVVAIPAAKPASRTSNNDYVYFASGDGYAYYDDSYYSDDLGNKNKKKKKKKKQKQQKQQQLQQGKNIEDDLGDFRCWKCNEKNYSDCVNNGEWEYCDDGQKGCFIEERKRRQHRGEAREIESVYTGCKQLNACIVLFNYNSRNNFNFFPQCFQEDSTWHRMMQTNHSTCRQCCGSSECNENWVYGYLITQADWEDSTQHRRT